VACGHGRPKSGPKTAQHLRSFSDHFSHQPAPSRSWKGKTADEERALEFGGLARQPWRVSWTATDQEQTMPLPGDDLVPSPMVQTTHATAGTPSRQPPAGRIRRAQRQHSADRARTREDAGGSPHAAQVRALALPGVRGTHDLGRSHHSPEPAARGQKAGRGHGRVNPNSPQQRTGAGAASPRALIGYVKANPHRPASLSSRSHQRPQRSIGSSQQPDIADPPTRPYRVGARSAIGGSTTLCDQSFGAVSVATSRLVAKDRGSAISS